MGLGLKGTRNMGGDISGWSARTTIVHYDERDLKIIVIVTVPKIISTEKKKKKKRQTDRLCKLE